MGSDAPVHFCIAFELVLKKEGGGTVCSNGFYADI